MEMILCKSLLGFGVEKGVSPGNKAFISALLLRLLPTSVKFQIVHGVTPPLGK